jgi:hypothetical protein
MLGIWKANAHKYKGSGIPLEFEKHEAFTSDETLDPALLTDMTMAERDVVHFETNKLTTGVSWTYKLGQARCSDTGS